MKYLLLVISIYLINLAAIGQVIPEDRTIDWTVVNQHINFKQPNIQVNVKDFGAVGNGITDDHQAVVDAIESLNGQLAYIYFPPGTYLITEPITLTDSCILKGESSDETILQFNFEGSPLNCIKLSRSQTSNFTAITGGINKGNNLITISNTNDFEAGDYIEIRQKNGSWDVSPISWADYSVGQMARVVSIIGNKLLIDSKLRIDYSPELEPEVRPVSPILNSGIQCLKIHRLDEPLDGAGANIYMYMAANCFVRGVESDTSVGAHFSINNSLNILVDGCYFHHAFTYDGAGMRGYGIALSQHTSECLITNNIFRYLRHAMMIKTGSNGNIFSYNYSLEPHRSEPIPDASGDISFHGHYAFSNLWEGNIVQNIVIDHYWGPSGPYNTIFRNKAKLWGIIMTTNELLETKMQNFVGNEVTNTEFLHGLYTITGEDHFEFGNNILGNILPTGTNDLPDQSYYLTKKPYFWSQFLEWPSVGIPLVLNSGTIPAKLRYESGHNFTICPDSIITSINSPSENIFNVWPNPANNTINISFKNDTQPIEISLINQYGNTIYISNDISDKITIPVSNIASGMYMLRVKTTTSITTKKVIIVH